MDLSFLRQLNCVKFINDRADGFLSEDALTYRINTTRAPPFLP